jgi:hypothetical protein
LHKIANAGRAEQAGDMGGMAQAGLMGGRMQAGDVGGTGLMRHFLTQVKICADVVAQLCAPKV